jgi:hypothetical protein
MMFPSIVAGVKAAPKKFKAALYTKKENFLVGIKSKENFKDYIRTPGSRNDPEGSKWSWSNEGTSPKLQRLPIMLTAVKIYCPLPLRSALGDGGTTSFYTSVGPWTTGRWVRLWSELDSIGGSRFS